MADRRRRRRRASQDSEDEDESASGSESGRSASPSGKSRAKIPEPGEAPVGRVGAKNDVESECESEDGVGEAVLSDYDSGDPEENGSHSEGGEEVEEESEHFTAEEPAPLVTEQKAAGATDAPAEVVGEEGGGEEEEEEEGEGDDEEEEEEEEEERGTKEVKGDVKGTGERQSGDGQESTDAPENKSADKPGQKLDDDEDRKNPAYIPRKGLFFEHDVRGQTQDEERPKGRHRKLWKDEGRWEHDKFREEDQAPKSREELIAIYGYDIRNGNGSSDPRQFRPRKPRYSGSLNHESKRYRDGEKPARSSWHGAAPGARGSPPMTVTPQSGVPAPPHPQNRPTTQPPARTFQSSRRPEIRSHTKTTTRPQAPESERAPRLRGRGSHGAPHQNQRRPQEEDEEEGDVPSIATTYTAHYYKSEQEPSSSQQKEESRTIEEQQSSTVREVSPPPERPVEKKSYSLARRTRTRPTDLSKQASLEEAVITPQVIPSAAKSESWQGPAETSTQGGLSRLDQDLARLSLAGQSWTQSPPSYLQPEMRGIPNSIHIGGGPHQYGNMEDMGVGGGRAKRYSSQRQRPVPEPAPMHIGLMEGHYYEPMPFQGPIYAHGDSPAAMPPQGLLVQPEMHLPHPTHPSLHPHQSGGPIPNPALYAPPPPVSLSPGQPPPQQLLAQPFYPPPGVMTFSNTNYPYPAGATLPPMYPNAQAQSQVYGGVTYFDPVQQQAQPKPSPPRRTSQPVTVKPPPPEDHSRKPSEEVRS